MNNNIKLFETFKNKGVGECVLLAKRGEKFLAGIKTSAEKEFCHFVVASYLDDNGSWCWGHYFSNLAEASNYLYEVPTLDYKRLIEAIKGEEEFEEEADYKEEIIDKLKCYADELESEDECGDMYNFVNELVKQLKE